jgi:hypothetical protein
VIKKYTKWTGGAKNGKKINIWQRIILKESTFSKDLEIIHQKSDKIN